ncbi:MAG: nucleotidyltransferase domain-containing protein [Candidatus Gastranaerophilaceae bacterium]
MDLPKIINELNSKIKKKYSDFRGSYLYGSRARGDYHKDSDVDIVLLFDDYDRDKETGTYEILGDLDYKYDVVIMGILYTKKELERNLVFHNEVVNKGIYYNAA